MPEKPPSPRDIRREAWREGADAWEDSTREELEEQHALILSALRKNALPIGPETLVLDVGSGRGRLAQMLSKDGLQVVGLDARPRAQGTLMQAAGRAERMPFRPGQFDVVITALLYDEEVYDQSIEEMVREIARVLKPGGLYVWYVWSPDMYDRLEALFKKEEELELVQTPSAQERLVVFKKRTHA
ncbi:hypothetical protein COU20_01810 [Candidatus Kaiserbacteria bacterium CG10_big_fil_rev_8_21_14_0_10_59_10]|uniref:Methyltransferase type 11 domain-containing protein n=1 Tax=Candidatus Kaiserbacteria bacterium CG10_big_fil_rev_8_21_14_0_10_59_10 TaxID=1974612 RepID=A0A2H0U9Z4_9BACT|nr:MAG: hypothetical protein COU20_01810 [Candidatus Kaiserbacteria bacterium CG10_big_fil_rev_8_21_14_0_10_59_10]